MGREIQQSTTLFKSDTGGRSSATSDYLDKLYKIIPAELTAAYVAISSLLTDQANPLANWGTLLGFGIFLTVLTPLYLWRLQNVKNVMQLAVSTISFPIWAICISTAIVTVAVPALTPQLIAVVMIAWVLATPLLVPPSKR